MALARGDEPDSGPAALACTLLRRPIAPEDLRHAGTCVLAGAARLDGRRADAAFTVNWAEHTRRTHLGAAAYLDCASLETMWHLPVDEAVPLEALGEWERENLCILPAGSVTLDRGLITRKARPVVELHAVTATGSQLRPLIRRLAPFLRATQCVAVLQARARNLDDQLWEADAAGIGVWLGVDNPVELVKPDSYRPTAMTSGRWMFSERVYDAWLNAMHPIEPSSGPVDRPTHRDCATPRRPSPSRLLD